MYSPAVASLITTINSTKSQREASHHISLFQCCVLWQVCGHAAEDISNYRELFPSIFSAQALTNCDMFTLEASEFHQLVEEYPKVKVKLHAWAVR